MRKPFKHLNKEDRDLIAVLLGKETPIREIARRLRRSDTTILREIRRNKQASRSSIYLPHKAQERADQRHRTAHKNKRLKSFILRDDIEQMLMNKWSPPIIAGYLKRLGGDYACSESIYQWIYKEAPHLIGYLPRSHPKRRQRRFKRARRVRIPERISIHQRPEAVLSRQEPGHWEADLMVGRGQAALQVLTERKARFVRLKKIPNKTAVAARQAICELLRPFPSSLRRTITYDNGLENAEHLIINQELMLQSYFCEPYHSWEKGSVENVNGIIRWFFPKGTDFSTIPDEDIERLESWLNQRPRKILQFSNPADTLKSFGWCIST